jgi:hypothetical protein
MKQSWPNVLRIFCIAEFCIGVLNVHMRSLTLCKLVVDERLFINPVNAKCWKF